MKTTIGYLSVYVVMNIGFEFYP